MSKRLHDHVMLERINDIARASYVEPGWAPHWDDYRIELAAEEHGCSAERDAMLDALDAARSSYSRVSEAITASISESYAVACVMLLAGHGIADELDECASCSVRTCSDALVDDDDGTWCVMCRERGADRSWVA